MNTVTQNALDLARTLIKVFEGCRLIPYLDIAGKPTIAYGNTFYKDGSSVKLVDKELTQQQADDLFEYHLIKECVPAVEMLLNPLEDYQNASLLSLIYNIGAYAFIKSSLYTSINNCRVIIKSEIANNFVKFNKYRKDGVLHVSDGLTKRRTIEHMVFNRDIICDEKIIRLMYNKV